MIPRLVLRPSSRPSVAPGQTGGHGSWLAAPSGRARARARMSQGRARLLWHVLLGLALGSLAATPAEAREVVHEVRPGNTLSALARRYRTTVEAIEQANGLAPGKTIRSGQRLRIPVADPPARKTRAPKSEQARAPAPAAPDRAPVRASAKHLPRSATRSAPADTEEASDEEPSAAGGAATRARRQRDDTGALTPSPATKDLAPVYARKPPRPGYVTLIRFSERFTGQLVDDQRRVLPAAQVKVSKLMRDLRARQVVPIDRRLLQDLAAVSDYFGGRPIVIVSGFRMYASSQYTRDSRHNYGKAVDFRVVGVPNEAVRDFCLRLPKNGVGYYPNSTFVHLDTRLHKAAWVDASEPGQAPSYLRPRRPRSPAAVAAGVKSNRPDRSATRRRRTASRAPAGQPGASRSGRSRAAPPREGRPPAAP